MARSKSSSRWLKEHFSDPFVKSAKQKGHRSRAVFKLIEIQEKDRLFRPGMVVVDLGAAPGSWSEIIKKWVGEKGRVIALDILPMEKIPGVEIIEGDFTEESVFNHLLTVIDHQPVDLVISDMAPNISGMSEIDQPRVMYLAELALDLASKILKPNGSMLVKLFQGEGFDHYLKTLRSFFKKIQVRKPKASRARSREIYLLATGFHGI